MSVSVDRDQAFLNAIGRVAEEVAAPNADAVDREARFPAETIAGLRAEGALSAFIPTELGGGGVAFETIAAACFELGRRCGASAMVFAMHQIQVATIVRHLDDAPWFENYLRDVAAEQRLIASVTSEVGTGGDMGSSIASVEPAGEGIGRFEKQAPTVSYGAYADDLLTTLRRAPDAEPGDQVCVLTSKDQHTLEPTGSWDPLGMRGTCSPGNVVRAELPLEQVLPTQFALRHERVDGADLAHPLVAPVARHRHRRVHRARAFVRAAAKRKPGEVPPAAIRLSELMSELSLLRAEVSSGLREFVEASAGDRARLSEMASILRFNNLKIAASEQAPRVCQGALGVCGIMGFKNDTPFSVGRHLRDTMSACLMVANERIHQTNASLLLIAKDV